MLEGTHTHTSISSILYQGDLFLSNNRRKSIMDKREKKMQLGGEKGILQNIETEKKAKS